jgi:hypothetical protein
MVGSKVLEGFVMIWGLISLQNRELSVFVLLIKPSNLWWVPRCLRALSWFGAEPQKNVVYKERCIYRGRSLQEGSECKIHACADEIIE